MKRRKMRKQVKSRMNAWHFAHEPGERVFDYEGTVFDLRESRGRNKAAAGELTPVLAEPQKRGAEAVCIEGVWYWQWPEKNCPVIERLRKAK